MKCIVTIDESNFYEETWTLISNRLIGDGERTISDRMEDNIEEIVDDIRNYVHTLPGLSEKYDQEDIYAAIDNSEVFISYYNRYLLTCIKFALSGYSEDSDGNLYDEEGNIVENEYYYDNE
jgi:hypothetical protein